VLLHHLSQVNPGAEPPWARHTPRVFLRFCRDFQRQATPRPITFYCRHTAYGGIPPVRGSTDGGPEAQQPVHGCTCGTRT
jgi:hypothetical protein